MFVHISCIIAESNIEPSSLILFSLFGRAQSYRTTGTVKALRMGQEASACVDPGPHVTVQTPLLINASDLGSGISTGVGRIRAVLCPHRCLREFLLSYSTGAKGAGPLATLG